MAFVKTGDKVGIIDKDGKYVANPQFDELPRLYMLNMAYGIPATSVNYDVTTRYFNVEKAVDMVMDNVTKEGIKGITLKPRFQKLSRILIFTNVISTEATERQISHLPNLAKISSRHSVLKATFSKTYLTDGGARQAYL